MNKMQKLEDFDWNLLYYKTENFIKKIGLTEFRVMKNVRSLYLNEPVVRVEVFVKGNKKWIDKLKEDEYCCTYHGINVDGKRIMQFLILADKISTKLVNWLKEMEYDLYDDFLEVIENIEDGYADLERYKERPSVYCEEQIEFLKTDIKDWEEKIAEIKSHFLKENKTADWELEIESVSQWWKNKQLIERNELQKQDV